MRFAVIGAGAVGGYYGGRLVAAGEDVHWLYNTEYDVVRERGVTVESCDGDFHFRPRAYRSAGEMPPCDLVVVALKSAATPILESILPSLMTPSSAVLCLQNGLGHEERIAAWTGEERVMAGSAFICSERTAPGVIRHTAAGRIRLGPFASRMAPGAPAPEAVAAAFARAGVRCEAVARGVEIKWSKLVWNVPFSGLSIYYGGVTTEEILAVPERAEFARKLMHEVILAARSDRVELDPSLVETNLAATAGMGAYRTSMTLDFLAGRPIEVEAILVEPLRRGRRAGFDLPAFSELHRGVAARLEAHDR